MRFVMVSATGKFFIIEPFGFTWMFEGLPGLGYWDNIDDMIGFYKEAFGMVCVGEL